TSFIPTVLVRGLLGWEPDAPTHTIKLSPQLPADWDSLKVSNLAVGDRRYEVSFKKTAGSLSMTLRRTAGSSGDTLLFSPHLPAGSRVDKIESKSGATIPGLTPIESARDVEAPIRLVVTDAAKVEVSFQPGIEIILPSISSLRGDRSKG